MKPKKQVWSLTFQSTTVHDGLATHADLHDVSVNLLAVPCRVRPIVPMPTVSVQFGLQTVVVVTPPINELI